MEIMAEAFEIVAGMSPSATHWIVNASPQKLQDAVADRNQDVSPPGREILEPVPATSPEPTPETNGELAPVLALEAAQQTDPPDVPVFAQLYPCTTKFNLEVSPDDSAKPVQQPAFLTVILPPGFHVNEMSSVRQPSLPAPPPLEATPADGVTDPAEVQPTQAPSFEFHEEYNEYYFGGAPEQP